MSFLLKYISEKKKRLFQKKSDVSCLAASDSRILRRSGVRDLISSLSKSGISIVAEFKRASPTAGNISEKDIITYIKSYQDGGADAISILTEPNYFKGSLEDLKIASENTSLPVLRKDFITSEDEIRESFIFGADSFLLISEAFDNHKSIEDMISYGRSLGMEPILEFFSEEGGEKAIKTSAKIIGINSRDLHVLDVDLKRAISLLEKFKRYLENRIVIAESGMKSKDDIRMFLRYGIRRFLIGETLMRAEDPTNLIMELKSVHL